MFKSNSVKKFRLALGMWISQKKTIPFSNKVEESKYIRWDWINVDFALDSLPQVKIGYYKLQLQSKYYLKISEGNWNYWKVLMPMRNRKIWYAR